MTEPGALRRRAPVVNFNQADASAVVQSTKQGGVKARRQRRGYGRLAVVCRHQTRRGDFRSLQRVILPVVIRDEKGSITVAQLQRWICQDRRSRERSGSEARADTTDYYSVIGGVAAEEEARNHDVVVRADEGARAQVGQFRANSLVEVVDFNQGHPRAVILPSHDRRIRSRIQRHYDR